MKELQIFGDNIGEYLMTLPHKIDKFSYIKMKTYHLIKRHYKEGKDKSQSGRKYSAVNKRFISRIYKKLQIIRER